MSVGEDSGFEGDVVHLGREPASRVPVPERLLIALLVLTASALIGMSLAFDQSVAWKPLMTKIAPGVSCVGLGLLIRVRSGPRRLAMLLVSVGFFSSFMTLIMMSTYMRFPLGGETIDPLLTRLDSMIGYDWFDWFVSVASWDELQILLWVYESAPFQLLAVIGLLTCLNREVVLQRFMLTGALSLVLTIAVWWVAPSFGPSTLDDIAPKLQNHFGVAMELTLGTELRRLGAEGNAVIMPDKLLAVVAFPSYHMIMALLVVWFTRGTPLFVIAVLVNLMMIPATLVQGAHHAVDLVGGSIIFAMSVVIVKPLVHTTENSRPKNRPSGLRKVVREP